MEHDCYRIFISHATSDGWIARQMARTIEECGASTFLAEIDIKTGGRYKQTIFQELNQSQEFVVLITNFSVQRRWVWAEIGAAVAADKLIIPVFYNVSLPDLEEQGGRDLLEGISIVELNNFDSYLAELRERILVQQNE